MNPLKIITSFPKITVVFGILFLFVGKIHFSFSQTPLEQKPVQSIRVIGVEKIPIKKIQKLLAGFQTPVFWKFWQSPPIYSQKKLDNIIEAIQQLYRQNGYYKTRLIPEVILEGGGAKILLKIKEGKPVKIQSLRYEIQDPKGERWEDTFQELVELYPGSIFRIVDYEKSKTKILEYLANNGYPRAKLTGKVTVYEKNNRATILFTIDPGQFTRFGEIHLEGNKIIDSKIIFREITFTKDEPFSLAKVFQSQGNIFKLNFFRSVLVNPINLAKGEGPIDVRITLQERKPRTIETGLGYGTEDNLRFRLSGIYRNFLGRAREIRFALKLSSLIEEQNLSFKQPYFPDSTSALRLKLTRKKDKFVSFNTLNISNETRLEKKFTPIFSSYLAHRLDSSKIYSISEATEKKLDFQQEKIYFLSYLQIGLLFNTSDSELNPTIGNKFSLFFEPSFKTIGSEISYIKGSIEYKNYSPLLKGVLLASRLTIGTIQPFGINERTIPLFKRFFSGGTYSVRGYSYQELGPKDESGKPVGGNSLIEGNIELRIPIKGRIWNVIFLDFGKVSLESGRYSINNWRYSVGTGIRYDTIVGPLRLDYGYLLNPDDFIKKRYRIHLNIGQAF